MAWWQWLLDSAGALLILVLLYGVLLMLRRRVLSRQGGTFELAARVRTSRAGRGWVLGLGRYHGDELQWFRIFSPLPRPERSWSRNDLSITSQREPQGEEAFALYGGHLVVQCRAPEGAVDLAMSPAALTGFSAWLEAGPPGADWDKGPSRYSG